MSRSNNVTVINPAKYFFEWAGGKEQGYFYYFDKTEGKKKKINLPFRFLVLDTLSTITGFSDSDNSGIWSNEVRDTKTTPFVVKTKNGVIKEGIYKEISDSIKNAGADYTASVYVAYMDNGEMVIAHLKLKTTALSAWYDFNKKLRQTGKSIYSVAVSVNESTEGKKGSVMYRTPVFSEIPASEESERKAKELDRELQDYLNRYLVNKESVRQSDPVNIIPDDVINDLPPSPEEYMHPVSKDNNKDKSSSPVITDDLPF